jgi:hypothetical protein
VLDAARRDPSRLHIAIDPVADAMASCANRARRERLANVLFVAAAVEALPCELDGVADRITVLFPWGSLLAGVARPESDVLASLVRIARPGAALDVVINRSAETYSTDGLATQYAAAGIAIERIERTATAPYTTTWGKRVSFHADVLHVRGRILDAASMAR